MSMTRERERESIQGDSNLCDRINHLWVWQALQLVDCGLVAVSGWVVLIDNF
jgi:hypothetical protein